jgi:hypothetical protein
VQGDSCKWVITGAESAGYVAHFIGHPLQEVSIDFQVVLALTLFPGLMLELSQQFSEWNYNFWNTVHRMYRVFVHVYIHHFDKIKEMDHLNAEAHLNTLFRHFYFFVVEFHLLSEKDLEPLADLVKKICT